MKHLFFYWIGFLLCCHLQSFAQSTHNKGGDVRLYKNYDNYKNNNALSPDSVRLPNDTSSISLSHYAWALQDSTGLFRIANNKLYKVEDTDGLVIYSVLALDKDNGSFAIYYYPYFPYLFSNWADGPNVKKEYYFSKDMNGPILPLSVDNLKLVVHNETFLKIAGKKFRWYNYNIYDRGKHDRGFMLNEIYRKTVLGKR